MTAATTQHPQRRSAVPTEIAQFIERQEQLRSAAASLGGRPLVALAEIVTQLASRQKLVEADALDLYQRCRTGGPSLPAATSSSSSPPAVTRSEHVQASKLRQFILLGHRCGREGVELIRRAKAIHAEICRSPARDRLKYSSTYSALVAVARIQLARPSTRLGARGGVRTPTDAGYRKVLLR